ncbi:MAG: AtpZ/AtpI family protein [Methylocystis sp.]
MTEREGRGSSERLADAARKAAARDREGRRDPEPSLGRRLGQIGVLGWTIVVPALLGLLAGRWLDKTMKSGVLFSAPAVMLGAALGLWLAWKWMSRQ